ncbi:uncharacterized protein LTR77_004548 [Saxophila tyrrhenica]|uniref:Uncharacterized protein n=1 Tax=Saxophila tyrrhenica TaxID=1690608 RepID=A0AAV9PD77_9PEZI|nr:hypothetical protein LTR77_004548 [Saxophila tyrrhenica]
MSSGGSQSIANGGRVRGSSGTRQSRASSGSSGDVSANTSRNRAPSPGQGFRPSSRASIDSHTDEAFFQALARYGLNVQRGVPSNAAEFIVIAVCEHNREPPSETFLRRLNPEKIDLKNALMGAMSFIISTCDFLIDHGDSDHEPLINYYLTRWHEISAEIAGTEPGKSMLRFVLSHCLQESADASIWKYEATHSQPPA